MTRSVSSRLSTPSSTKVGPRDGSNLCRPRKRQARQWRWWALARRVWLRHNNSRVPVIGSRCMKKMTASVVCCATAFPTSKWRRSTSTAASNKCRPKAWCSKPACWSVHGPKTARSPIGRTKPSLPISSKKNLTPCCSPAVQSNRETYRCLGVNCKACISPWNFCRSKTKSMPATV